MIPHAPSRAHNVLQLILVLCLVLSLAIFFLYRGDAWPLGIQGIEALGALGIVAVSLLAFIGFERVWPDRVAIRPNSVSFGLLTGLLWTLEISMNNFLQPPLPARDIYDDVWWAIVALMIFGFSFYIAVKTAHLRNGIAAGLWSGYASGAVACLTALSLIVFGMGFILSDKLNIEEWTALGASGGTPGMAVYFAYQTLAGAILHLTVLGIIMGGLLGLVGGILGKGIVLARMLLAKRLS